MTVERTNGTVNWTVQGDITPREKFVNFKMYYLRWNLGIIGCLKVSQTCTILNISLKLPLFLLFFGSCLVRLTRHTEIIEQKYISFSWTFTSKLESCWVLSGLCAGCHTLLFCIHVEWHETAVSCVSMQLRWKYIP